MSAFGEHLFTEVTDLSAESPEPVHVNHKWLTVILPPGGILDLRLGMRRFVHTPGYERPL